MQLRDIQTSVFSWRGSALARQRPMVSGLSKGGNCGVLLKVGYQNQSEKLTDRMRGFKDRNRLEHRTRHTKTAAPGLYPKIWE